MGSGPEIAANTVKRMIDIIKESSENEKVRKFGEFVVQDVPARDEMGECEAVYYFVRDHLRYTKDPISIEYLQTPLYLIQQLEKGIQPSTDCDDYTILSLSLLRSLGYPTTVRTTGYFGSPKFTHVYGMVRVQDHNSGLGVIGGSKYIPMDCIRNEKPFLWQPPNPTRVRDYEID